MSKRIQLAVRVMLLAVLVASASGALIAEVSTDRGTGDRPGTLLMDLRGGNGMTDGADPIPNLRWDQHRRIPDVRVLNREGAVRLDGRPDVAFKPFIYSPVVVWAWNHQTDHDIVFSEWTDAGWSEAEFLASDRDVDQIDPRVFVDRTAGVHVVWAVPGEDPHIMYVRRGADGDWRQPQRVSVPGENVGKPTVAAVGSTLAVAYEQLWYHNEMPRRSVVVRRLSANQSADGDDSTAEFDFSHVFHVPREAETEPILHVRGGRMWVDWKHTNGFFAWSSFDDQQWSQVRLYPWTDPSWVGAENARRSIEHLYLSTKREDSTP